MCSSDNAGLVLGMGAEKVIDYRSEDFSRSGQLYDVIVDTVGNITLGRFRRATTARGILLAVDGGGTAFVRALWTKFFGTRKVFATVSADRQADLETVRDLVAAGVLRPTIDSRVAFADIAQAHARADSRRKRGAVVVMVAKELAIAAA